MPGNTHTVETTQVAKAAGCQCYSENLGNVVCAAYERHTKIDIIFEKGVSHVGAEIKVCPQCKKQKNGCFPEDMQGLLQNVPGIKGYMVNLLVPQMEPHKRRSM